MKASEKYKMRFVELLGHPITDKEITTYGRLVELETIITYSDDHDTIHDAHELIRELITELGLNS